MNDGFKRTAVLEGIKETTSKIYNSKKLTLVLLSFGAGVITANVCMKKTQIFVKQYTVNGTPYGRF